MQPTFEQSLSRLEEIVNTVENRDIDLETAMELYKEGLSLSKICGDTLNRYEAEIILLKRDFDGTFNQTIFPDTNLDAQYETRT